jgi:hypothetical protein
MEVVSKGNFLSFCFVFVFCASFFQTQNVYSMQHSKKETPNIRKYYKILLQVYDRYAIEGNKLHKLCASFGQQYETLVNFLHKHKNAYDNPATIATLAVLIEETVSSGLTIQLHPQEKRTLHKEIDANLVRLLIEAKNINLALNNLIIYILKEHTKDFAQNSPRFKLPRSRKSHNPKSLDRLYDDYTQDEEVYDDVDMPEEATEEEYSPQTTDSSYFPIVSLIDKQLSKESNSDDCLSEYFSELSLSLPPAK